MNVNLIGLLAVGLSLAAFRLAHGFAKPVPPKWRAFWFLLFGLCGSPAILSAVYYLHVLPEWAWFYELKSWRGSELFVILLGASAGCLAALLPRKMLVVILVLLCGTALVPYTKPMLLPLPAAALRDQWEGGACLQSTPSTCGPASITTILRHLGIEASEREIAHKAYTYAGGTEAWYLARFVRSKGLIARFDFRQGLPEDLRLPALIGVRLGNNGHFIPLLSREGEVVTIADPLHGTESLTPKDLEKRCQFTGFHLSITKD